MGLLVNAMDVPGEIRTFTIPEAGVDRLDVWLAQQCPDFSRARVQGLLRAGCVTVNGGLARRAAARAKGGDVVALAIPPPVPAAPAPEAIPLSILFEDDDLIALDKPAGLVVHPAPGHPTGTLVNALLHHCPALSGIGGVARPGIVHRLDQDTSGVMVAAKSQRAMDALTRAFAAHANLRKTYLALVHGTPDPRAGHIENLVGRCPFDRKKMAVVDRNGKRAATDYKTVAQAGPLTLVACDIQTGRTHQIRVHMAASLGCPIAGDALYGRPGWDRKLTPVPARQLLHAWRLDLVHPVTRAPLRFEAPLPADFRPFVGESPLPMT